MLQTTLLAGDLSSTCMIFGKSFGAAQGDLVGPELAGIQVRGL